MSETLKEKTEAKPTMAIIYTNRVRAKLEFAELVINPIQQKEPINTSN